MFYGFFSFLDCWPYCEPRSPCFGLLVDCSFDSLVKSSLMFLWLVFCFWLLLIFFGVIILNAIMVISMCVTISNCPYIFHDTEELSEFLLHCGKYLFWFDGQDVFVNGEYVLTIRIYYSVTSFRVCVSYQRSSDFLRAPAGGKI